MLRRLDIRPENSEAWREVKRCGGLTCERGREGGPFLMANFSFPGSGGGYHQPVRGEGGREDGCEQTL